jgi:sugar lactone lactonase YvrE
MTSGLRFPEGPVACADGSVIVTEIAAGRVTRCLSDGTTQVVAETGGGPNGLAFGPGGMLYCCNNGGFDYVDAGGLLIPHCIASDYSGGRIERIDVVALAPRSGSADAGPTSAAGFTILDSHRQAGGTTSLPADIAPCAACLAEVGDPTDRRHLHPFANCTDCGPRFTVIRALPYDRATTTL